MRGVKTAADRVMSIVRGSVLCAVCLTITTSAASADALRLVCLGKVKGKSVSYEVIVSEDRKSVTYLTKNKKATNRVVTYDSAVDSRFHTLNWETMRLYDKSSNNFIELFIGYLGVEAGGSVTWESEDGKVTDDCKVDE